MRILYALLPLVFASGVSRCRQSGHSLCSQVLPLSRQLSSTIGNFKAKYARKRLQQNSKFRDEDAPMLNARTGRREIFNSLLVAPILLSQMERAKAAAIPLNQEKKRVLPEGWQAVKDGTSGDVYYWQPSTDVTQWDFPGELQTPKGNVYTTVFGSKVEEPNHLLLWGKVVGLAFGLLMINFGLEFQSYIFPSLKEARENLDFFYEAAEKYGLKDDEPLEEVGYRAMEIMRKERIQALASGAVDVLDEVKDTLSENPTDATKTPSTEEGSPVTETISVKKEGATAENNPGLEAKDDTPKKDG